MFKIFTNIHTLYLQIYIHVHACVCTLQSKRIEMPTDSGTQGRYKKVQVTLKLIAIVQISKCQITFIKNLTPIIPM